MYKPELTSNLRALNALSLLVEIKKLPLLGLSVLGYEPFGTGRLTLLMKRLYAISHNKMEGGVFGLLAFGMVAMNLR